MINDTVLSRLASLREVMRREKLDAFVFPSTDPHHSEYTPDRWKGREWISGFDGSAGTAVVTMDSAALWTDSRYFLAAEKQLEGTSFQLMRLKVKGTPTIARWLADKLKDTNAQVGVDGMCNNVSSVENLIHELRRQGGITVRTNFDPLNEIWKDRPAIPDHKIEVYPMKYAGETALSKMRRVRATLCDMGADGMLVSALDETLCEQGRNFNNKIWNAFRLVEGWKTANIEQPATAKTAVEWFAAKLKETAKTLDEQFKTYRISEALMTVYRLFWDEFSAWYLEMVKPAYIDGQAQPIDKATYEATLHFFETLLQMLHPFMPFITEELWQHLGERKEGESIMTSQLHIGEPTSDDEKLCAAVENVKLIVAGVRSVRSQKQIAPKKELELQVVGTNSYAAFADIIVKMANLKAFTTVESKAADASAFMVDTDEFAVPVGDLIDVDAEIEKQEAQLKHLEGFLAGVKKKLAHEKFVAHAPEAVVERERKKQSDAEEKIAAIQESLNALKK